MKRTYVNRLPKNEEVKNTNVKIENGGLIVEVEFEEKFEPKNGYFCVSDKGYLFIFKNEFSIGYSGKYASCYCGIDADGNLNYGINYTIKNGRYATSVEKSSFLARLEKEHHKRWNEEKKCLEDIRWRAKEGEIYFYVDNCALVTTRCETFDMIDNIRYDLCNYFRYYESAQKVAEQIKDIFKNSKYE